MVVYSADRVGKAELTRHLLQHREQWIDLYDTEHLSSALLRRTTRYVLLFWPQLLVRVRLAKRNLWPETFALLGQSALECNDTEMAMLAYEWLIDDAGAGVSWGLPITWHVFPQCACPPRTMMSTTTAEVAFFLLELERRHGCVGHETLRRIGLGLLNGLHRVIDDGQRLQFAYTPYPGEPVNNANLLVASALWGIGSHTKCEELMTMAERTLLTCLSGLDPSGGITYFRGRDIVDSYHQLFSMRALYAMRDIDSVVDIWFARTIRFLERTFFDDRGGLLVRVDRPFYDMHASAEALRLYRAIGDSENYERVYRHIRRDLTHGGRYVQRAWITRQGLIHSNVLFTRQGSARLALGVEP